MATKRIHSQDPLSLDDLWKYAVGLYSCRLVLWVRPIHLGVYVRWIRMAQNRLVNYRHLLSKRGVCCQVLRHEVNLLLRGEKRWSKMWKFAWTNALPCALRLSVRPSSSACPSFESSSAVRTFTLTSHTLALSIHNPRHPFSLAMSFSLCFGHLFTHKLSFR